MATAPFVASHRPRTLVVAIEERELCAVLIGPWGEPVTSWARVDIATDMQVDALLHALWDIVETLGEFDRISAGCDAGWDRVALAEALARQSLRPARVVGAGELTARSAIACQGVELVLTLGARFGSALFVDGAALPDLDLGRHRFRKGMTYAEYLGGDAADRLGRRKWNKRALRAVDELLAVFGPRRLYLTGRNAELVHGELPAAVEIVAPTQRLGGALALWA